MSAGDDGANAPALSGASNFRRELGQRYGGARGWARHRGIPESLLGLPATRLVEG